MSPTRKDTKQGTRRTEKISVDEKQQGGEGKEKETSRQGQRSMKKTLHAAESCEGCSDIPGMHISTDRRPLALKKLLVNSFKLHLNA